MRLRLQMVFIVRHFRVVVGLDDVLPRLFSQIDRIAVTVLHGPAFAGASHVVAPQRNKLQYKLPIFFSPWPPLLLHQAPPCSPLDLTDTPRVLQ